MAEAQIPARRQLLETIVMASMLVILAPAFLGIMSVLDLLRAVFDWFKTGQWHAHTLWYGLQHVGFSDRPWFSWVIPNNILAWVLDGSLWFWGPVLGMIYLFALIAMIGVVEKVAKPIASAWKERSEKPPLTLSRRAKVILALLGLWLIAAPIGFTSIGGHPDYGTSLAIAFAFLVMGVQLVGLGLMIASAVRWTGRLIRND